MDVQQLKSQIDQARVACKLCGYQDHSLVAHLKKEHSLSPGAYVKANPGAPFISKILLAVMDRMGRKHQQSPDISSFAPFFTKPVGPVSQQEEILFQRMTEIGAQVPTAEELKWMVPKVSDTFMWTDKVVRESTAAVLYAVSKGKNVYVEGPTGCGKSELIMQIFARMGRPILRKNMHGDTTAANFVGCLEVNAGGTYFKEGALPRAMQGGFAMLCDEIDFAPAPVCAVLHPVLEGGRTMYIPETGQTLIGKEGFLVIGTANTGGKGDIRGTYSGVEIMNAAFLDRFAVKIRMEYMEYATELEMLGRKVGGLVTEDELSKVLKLAGEIRTGFKQGNLSVTMTTRKLLEYCEMSPQMGKNAALKMTVMNWLEPEEYKLVAEMARKVKVDWA